MVEDLVFEKELLDEVELIETEDLDVIVVLEVLLNSDS